MDFSRLTPSVAPLSGFEPVDREPGQAKRLTVLLGAGASRFAGAPSTNTLTDTVSQLPLCRQILEQLCTSAESDPNFEDVLQVLEDLDDFYATEPPRSAAILRNFVALASPVWPFFANNRLAGREERLSAIEAIADAFAEIDYDRHWRTLYELFRPFFCAYDIDVFTLNYDLVADCSINALAALSGKKYFTGFGTGPINMDGSEAFRADQYANPQWDLNLTLAHIHGSLAYAYNPGNSAMAYADPLDIVEAQTIRLARRSWAVFHNRGSGRARFHLRR